MYQSKIEVREITPTLKAYGLWSNGYGWTWFKTLAEAERAYKSNPCI